MHLTLPVRPRVLAVAAAVLVVLVNAVVPSQPAALAGGPADPAAVDAWLDAQRRDAGIPGAAVVIVRDGQVVHTAGFGSADASGRPVTPDTPFVLGSVSKSMTALLVMHLAERGTIRLDDPVRRYLPAFSLADPAAGAAITVRQLLTQTSGIPTSAGLAPLETAVTTLEARVRDLAAVQPVSAPGEAYHYSNANYVVLGRLVEVVTGEPFAVALRAGVLAPLGMTHASADRSSPAIADLSTAHRLFFGLAGPDLRPLDRPDLAPAGFIAASASDLGRYLAGLLDPRGPGDGTVASAAGVTTLFQGVTPTGLGDERYAMGWTDGTLLGERVIAHSGSTTDMASFVAIVPSRRLAVAVVFNAQSPLYELLHKPDAIGAGVLALELGQAPSGTIELLYPAVDLLFAVVVLLLARGLVRLARDGGRSRLPGSRPGRLTWLALRGYLDVAVPLGILLAIPALLGASWPALVRTDLGVMFATVGLARLADGLLRVGVPIGRRFVARRGRRDADNAASVASLG